MHTLVFHHGALGDSVLLWPLLRALGPTRLVSAVSKGKLAARYLDNITALDGESPHMTSLFASMADERLDEALRGELAEAQRIISFISNGHDAWADNVRRLAPAAHLHFVDPRPPAECNRHVSVWHRDQLADQQLHIEPIHPAGRRNPTGPVIVHPGSGGMDKCWPAERFEQLVDRLQAAQRTVRVVLGPAERDRWPQRRIEQWRRQHDVIEPRDVMALAELIGGASLYIGNDSGPMHLAAQLGVPTLALFGPTDADVWGPLGPAVRIIRPQRPAPMTWLTVNAVGAVSLQSMPACG